MLQAFEGLGRNILDYVFNPTHTKILDDVLTYHAVSGAVASKDLKDGQQIPTLQGSDVTAHVNGADIRINTARVIKADVQASNGESALYDGFIW